MERVCMQSKDWLFSANLSFFIQTLYALTSHFEKENKKTQAFRQLKRAKIRTGVIRK